MEEKETAQLPVSPQETQIQPPASPSEASSEGGSFLDKLKIHKFKILGAVLGVLIFVGAVFGAYKLGQKQVSLAPQSTPTPAAVATPTPDLTANWKTYTNTKYGYSVKYPEELYFDETKTLFIEEKYKDIGRGGIPFIQIDVFDNNKQSLKDFFSAHATKLKFDDPDVSKPGSSLYFPEYSEPEEITIAGQKALRFTTESMEGRLTHTLLIKDKYTYDLVAGIEITTDLPTDNIKRFYNLMLSTFKFLEEKEGWKSYRSMKFNYSIKYPSDWQMGRYSETGNYDVWFMKLGPDQPPKSSDLIDGVKVEILVLDNPDKTTLEEWFKKQTFQANVLSKEDVTVGGIKGIKAVSQIPSYTVVIYLPYKDNKILVFNSLYPGAHGKEYRDEFDQILSTFHFLE